MKVLKWLTRIGPGFVICAVVLGPGSLTASTTLGSKYGYGLLWLPLVAGVAMAGFTTLFMRFGIQADKSVLEHSADLLGRWFAVLCGLAMFFVCASFQFGNNIGVATGMDSLLARSVVPGQPIRSFVPWWGWILGFNGLAIVFLFAFRKVYAVIEKTMTTLVAIMVVVFFANLYFARPSPASAARGLAPVFPPDTDWFSAAACVATTFSVVAAMFQSYLVRARRWSNADYAKGAADSVSGIAILTVVSMVVMMTSAAVLHPRQIAIRSAADMAGQLEHMFGAFSRIIFCIGFVSAAFSSFLVNAMIGGTLLADGFGLGEDINSRPARTFSVVALLAGMAVALLVRSARVPLTDALMLGEAGTLLTIPLAIVAAILALFFPRRAGARPLSLAGVLMVLFGVGQLLFLLVMSFEKILLRIRHTFGG